METEIRAMQRQIQCHNIEQLGEIPTTREDGIMRILVCQMGSCTSVETRVIKIVVMERRIRKYDTIICAFSWS